MRWCFFSPGYKSRDVLAGDTRTSGGAEAQVAYLATALAQLGHDVALIYGHGQTEVRTDMVAGVTCIDAAPCWKPASLATFWRAMEFLSPDLLYARLPSDFLWIVRLFARRSGARFIYALASPLHCNPWMAYTYNRWFHAPMFALGLYGADVIAIQHREQSKLISPRLRPRTAHVPNLVRSFNERPRAYDATTLDGIWIGVIRPEKEIEHFLDLAEALPDLRFAVVGGFAAITDVGLRVLVESRVQSLDNLSLFGPQRAEDVLTLLTRSKVLVNTSPTEGFPNTMLEAWSVGVPVVSLSVDPGGIIKQEQLGLMSETKERLIQDVSTLARGRDLNEQIGRRGLSYVRRLHSLEAVCEALMQALPGVQLVPSAAAS